MREKYVIIVLLSLAFHLSEGHKFVHFPKDDMIFSPNDRIVFRCKLHFLYPFVH